MYLYKITDLQAKLGGCLIEKLKANKCYKRLFCYLSFFINLLKSDFEFNLEL